MYRDTLLSFLSVQIAEVISPEVISRAFSCTMLNTDVDFFEITVVSASYGSGNHERVLALSCCRVGLNWISYWYAESSIAQRCNCAAANGGIPFLGLNMTSRGLWLVMSRHFQP